MLFVAAGFCLLLGLLALSFWRHRRARAWWKDALAVGIIALAVAGCFWRVFAVPGYWLPEGGGDNASTLLPFYRFAAEEFRAGRLPLWNPYLYGGAPFAADIQAAVFYPPYWGLYATGIDVTFELITALALGHLAFAGVGMYALATLGRWEGVGPLSRPAALVAAIAFMLCDYFIVHLGNLNLVVGAAWLPWATLGIVRGIDGRRVLPFALGGAAPAFGLLAGHIQPFLYGLLLAAALTLVSIARALFRTGPREAIGLAARALVFPLVAAGLAAIQILPSLELQGLTGRAAIGYEAAIQFSLPPAMLLGLLVPDIWGRGPGSYWGPWPRVEMGYFGILPLVSVAVALAMRRAAGVWALATIGLLALLLALGGYTVVYGWVYQFFPGFGGIRAPARAIILFNLIAAWLAAVGVDAALGATDDAARRTLGRVVRWCGFGLLGVLFGALPPFVFFLAVGQGQRGATTQRLTAILDGLVLLAIMLGGALLLFGLRAAGRIDRRTFAVAVVLWTAFDLLTIGFDVEGGGSDPLANFRRDAVVTTLRADPDPFFRIDSETGVWDVWQPAAGLYHRLADVRGVDNPLMIADVQRYWSELGGRNGAPYDLLNVRYVLAKPEARLEPTEFERVGGDETIVIYRNRTSLPRTWIVPAAEVVADHEAAFAAVHRQGFDPRRTVVLEGGPAERGGDGTATIVEAVNDRIVVDASAPAGGWLVLSETFYPGWEATVDGRPAEIRRANYLFRAVWLPAGEHRVELVYRPTSLLRGAAVAGVTTLGVVLLWAAALRRPTLRV
ncbi:MAG: YfhO family protein [Dehalococcoidia bacterium]